MNQLLSTIPPDGGWHPLIIHFPVALFPVTTLFLIGSIVWKRQRWVLMWVALALMAMGALGSYVAVVTGEDAKEHVVVTKENSDTLTQHQEAAENVWLMFTVLTAIYASMAWSIYRYPDQTKKYFVLASVVFLLCYLFVLSQLILVGHLGGTLVHKYGVYAMMR